MIGASNNTFAVFFFRLHKYWSSHVAVISIAQTLIFITFSFCSTLCVQEFYALKRRCSGQDGNCLKCFCFVAVRIVVSPQFPCSSLVLCMHKLQLVSHSWFRWLSNSQNCFHFTIVFKYSALHLIHFWLCQFY